MEEKIILRELIATVGEQASPWIVRDQLHLVQVLQDSPSIHYSMWRCMRRLCLQIDKIAQASLTVAEMQNDHTSSLCPHVVQSKLSRNFERKKIRRNFTPLRMKIHLQR